MVLYRPVSTYASAHLSTYSLDVAVDNTVTRLESNIVTEFQIL